MFYENLRIRYAVRTFMLFTIFGLDRKKYPYFPFHNVGKSVIISVVNFVKFLIGLFKTQF